jgi:ATP-binding cassette subfamily F protein uup
MFEGNGKWIEYAGGYSDMLAQRGRGVETRERKAEAPRKASPPQMKAQSAKRKLSFKQKHALDTLPAKMAEVTAEIHALEAKLADPGLFANDPKAFATCAARLSAARADLLASETQWLELEMLREELEGA